MTFDQFLEKKRATVIKKWFDLVVETYPAETQRFLRKEKDQFGNPVGSTIRKEMQTLYEALLGEGERDRIASSLDNIIRIRAIQDFTPSQAVGFVARLKGLIRDELEDWETDSSGVDPSEELRAIEQRIDDALLMAFDIYSGCRERLYNVRADEIKRQVSRLLKRAKLVCEPPDEEPDL